MGIRITPNHTVEKNLSDAQQQVANSLEKLSSGIKFSRADPLPADRAMSDSMQLKLKDYNAQKKNASDAISLVQTADGSLNEISNITVRLRELATQAASPTLSDVERKFLFVEYQGLYNEVTRIAKTTTFNGMPLLNSDDPKSPKELKFRIGSAVHDGGEDLNIIQLENVSEIIATSAELGLKSAEYLLGGAGISIDDVVDLFDADDDSVDSSFESALTKIASLRTGFGAIGERLSKVIDVIDVSYENLSSANSRLRDVDYATETANLARANILVQAGAALITQSNLPAQAALTLIKLLD